MGQHFFVSDGSNYENSKIRFPYFAPYFKGKGMEIREVFIGVSFRSAKTAAPHLLNEARGYLCVSFHNLSKAEHFTGPSSGAAFPSSFGGFGSGCIAEKNSTA